AALRFVASAVRLAHRTEWVRLHDGEPLEYRSAAHHDAGCCARAACMDAYRAQRGAVRELTALAIALMDGRRPAALNFRERRSPESKRRGACARAAWSEGRRRLRAHGRYSVLDLHHRGIRSRSLQ